MLHVKRIIGNERGDATLIATIFVIAILMVLAFSLIPYFVFIVQRDNLRTIALQALRESEKAGYVSSAVMDSTSAKLALVGLGAVTKGGVNYPSYLGSTTSKVFRDDSDPTIWIVIKYPATNLSKIFTAIGGSNDSTDGFYYIRIPGRSEAYE